MIKQFWAGTEESYNQFLADSTKAKAMKDEFIAKGNDDDMPEFPPLYERVGSVGVVTISGTLVQGAAEWLRFFGYTGYADIKDALLQAVMDKDAKSILLAIDSPGGAVAGVREAREMVSSVAQVKPMNVYADLMCSAAYWLGAEAGHITLGDTATAGSLGVLRVHTEYTEAYAKEGVTKTVLRAGRFKALDNPYEKLSEDARAEIQQKLDDLYDTFMEDVASSRGTTKIIADQVMGQGRTFVGKRALEVGLVDLVGDSEAALAYATANRKLATKKTANFAPAATSGVAQASAVADNAATDTPIGQNMKRKLTAEQLAALAAGASLEAVTGKTTEELAKEEAEGADTEVETEDEAASATTEPAATTDTKTDTEVVAFLKAELATANVALAAANAKAVDLEAKVTTLEENQASLQAIVQVVTNNMEVALRKPKSEGLSATDLLAQHATLTAEFQKKFKVGAVASSTAATETVASSKKVALFSPRDAAAAKAIPVPNK